MKVKIRILINSFLMMVILVMHPSCKKDVSIVRKDPLITWTNPADITYGTLLSATQLNATADVPGTFVYTPVSGTKLEVGIAQNLKVDFKPTDVTNYNSISKSVKINVTAVVTVTDIDGNVYHMVTIGTQVWMVENLNVTKYNDGTAIPKVTDGSAWAASTTGAYCNYGNTDSYATTYGRLYNWHAVKTGKLAPAGWHIPNMDEWNTLVTFLGGPAIAGGKLKSIGSSWASPNAGATNETGFTALPGGDRSGNGGFASDGGHYEIGQFGIWWSSSVDHWGAWYCTMSYDESSIIGDNSEYNFSNNLNFGKSVRCIKGDVAAKKDPLITWANPADITYGTLLSATQLNATADILGTFVYTPISGTKLEVGITQNLKVDFTPLDALNYNIATKTVTINVTKINPIITWRNPMNIVYGTPLSATQLNATANVEGTFVYTPASGTILSVGAAQNLKVDFTPADAINYNTATKTVLITVTTTPPSTITDIDGNVYNTVTIGNQLWMAENLKTTKYNDGTEIPNITDITTWATLAIGAYSDYNNTPANSILYGRLYSWFTVDNNASTKVASNGGKNVCPTSWHVPTDTEWSTLTTYLGGENVAGGKLKETGTTHWLSPNTGATNETGFTALPGGITGYTFDGIGEGGYWWSSTEYSATRALYRYLMYNYSLVGSSNYTKWDGFSVRCVWDF